MEKRGISAATRGKILRYAKVIFRRAVSLEIIEADPCRAIRAPRVEKKEITFLAPEEVARLLDVAKDDLKPLFAVACYTGLRMGEITALQWKDVDFSKNLINVNKSWKQENGFISPKTFKSKRSVPMIQSLKEIMIRHYIRSGRPENETLVFPNTEGKPRDRHRLNNQHLNGARKKAGLPKIRFHDPRHTFASMMIESGCDTVT